MYELWMMQKDAKELVEQAKYDLEADISDAADRAERECPYTFGECKPCKFEPGEIVF